MHWDTTLSSVYQAFTSACFCLLTLEPGLHTDIGIKGLRSELFLYTLHTLILVVKTQLIIVTIVSKCVVLQRQYFYSFSSTSAYFS